MLNDYVGCGSFVFAPYEIATRTGTWSSPHIPVSVVRAGVVALLSSVAVVLLGDLDAVSYTDSRPLSEIAAAFGVSPAFKEVASLFVHYWALLDTLVRGGLAFLYMEGTEGLPAWMVLRTAVIVITVIETIFLP